MKEIREDLKEYVEREIIPRYNCFDKAHDVRHALTVIEQSLHLSVHYPVDTEMVYAAAAYHDTGLAEGREIHHLASGRIIREDSNLRRWFTEEEIETIACAAEDHRASSGHPPRSIYGRIVAEADRIIDPETIIRRTVQYGLSHYPELDREGHWKRMLEHMKEKYAEGGFLKLWIPESPNAQRLKAFRTDILGNPTKLRALFDKAFDENAATERTR